MTARPEAITRSLSLKELTLGPAQVRWTNARHGNLGHWPPRAPHNDECCGESAVARRRQVRDGEWMYLTQVHGPEVVVVQDSISRAGSEADAAVTSVAELTLAIATADCAPIALSSKEGLVAAIHAGWRGLRDGVIGRTARVMRTFGATELIAAVGPCIHAECYEFDNTAELKLLGQLWGDGAIATTREGTPALDLTAAVAAACEASDIDLAYVDSDCTSCSGSYFSFRARKDESRQVMLVWRAA